MVDRIDHILAGVESARESGRPLYIRGGNSKRELIGRHCEADELDVSGHRGILDYQPAELYLSARAGTPLSEITAELEQHNQVLPFEPPLFNGIATLGGTLACNLSGPARPWSGSIRDMAMGVELVNGRAERLRFGGKVVKNVAGYDATRLQAGALGCLGILTEVTVKVLPRPEQSMTLVFELGVVDALEKMNRLAGTPKPLSGACWLDGKLYLRLSGGQSAVLHTATAWGGDERCEDHPIWTSLAEMSLPFFKGPEPLWRFSVNSASPAPDVTGAILIDWGGSQRWLRGEHDKEKLQKIANAGLGHVSLFREGDRSREVRPTLLPHEQQLQQRLKQAFDPQCLFNPGRLYSWM